jgi:AhpD family alkylhydroperoxidase
VDGKGDLNRLASLINGCAYCADMHTKVARSRGETEQRLHAVSLWKETPFYSDRERAALAWTEAVTLISVDHVPDEVYELARQHFTEKELVDLTLAIVAINGWNRLAIAFKTVPGTFQLRVRPSIVTRRESRTSRRVAETMEASDDHIETRVRPGLAYRRHAVPGGTPVAPWSVESKAQGRRVAEGGRTQH